jgi:hypothetical protein
MVKYTRRKRVNNRKTKQRGGLTNAQKAAMASLGSVFAKGGPPLSTRPKQTPVPTQANAPSVLQGVPNGPLSKYKKMSAMGQPQGVIIQKMKMNGKNPMNIKEVFPEYVNSTATVVKTSAGFTLDELRDLKDYVDRSEIIVRLHKLGINPKELYPELSEKEISDIIQDYLKPRDTKESVVIPVGKTSGKSLMNELSVAVKGRNKVNGVKTNISFFTDYTDQERTDLNTIDTSKARIKEIENVSLPVAKKSIKKSEEKGEQIKDFQLKKIIDLLKEKRDLELTVSTLLTDELKNKIDFVKGNIESMTFLYDKEGRPLPKGWILVVNSKEGSIFYRNKYTNNNIVFERPTEEALPVDNLPKGWKMYEDKFEAWYINELTNYSQWEVPTEDAYIN